MNKFNNVQSASVAPIHNPENMIDSSEELPDKNNKNKKIIITLLIILSIIVFGIAGYLYFSKSELEESVFQESVPQGSMLDGTTACPEGLYYEYKYSDEYPRLLPRVLINIRFPQSDKISNLNNNKNGIEGKPRVFLDEVGLLRRVTSPKCKKIIIWDSKKGYHKIPSTINLSSDELEKIAKKFIEANATWLGNPDITKIEKYELKILPQPFMCNGNYPPSEYGANIRVVWKLKFRKLNEYKYKLMNKDSDWNVYVDTVTKEVVKVERISDPKYLSICDF
jgi:hypothetical protein